MQPRGPPPPPAQQQPVRGMVHSRSGEFAPAPAHHRGRSGSVSGPGSSGTASNARFPVGPDPYMQQQGHNIAPAHPQQGAGVPIAPYPMGPGDRQHQPQAIAPKMSSGGMGGGMGMSMEFARQGPPQQQPYPPYMGGPQQGQPRPSAGPSGGVMVPPMQQQQPGPQNPRRGGVGSRPPPSQQPQQQPQQTGSSSSGGASRRPSASSGGRVSPSQHTAASGGGANARPPPQVEAASVPLLAPSNNSPTRTLHSSSAPLGLGVGSADRMPSAASAVSVKSSGGGGGGPVRPTRPGSAAGVPQQRQHGTTMSMSSLRISFRKAYCGHAMLSFSSARILRAPANAALSFPSMLSLALAHVAELVPFFVTLCCSPPVGRNVTPPPPPFSPGLLCRHGTAQHQAPVQQRQHRRTPCEEAGHGHGACLMLCVV